MVSHDLILVANPDEERLHELVRLLTRFGYDVRVATTDGEAILEAAETLRPKLVVTDVELGGSLSGVETARRLREELDIPVIFATGCDDPATLTLAGRALPAGFVFQPVGELDLRATIDVALSRGELLSELRSAGERFAKIFRYSHDAIIVADPDRDQILEANPKACRLLGYGEHEIRSLKMSDIHPNEMPKVRAFAALVSKEGHGYTNELSCRTKLGTLVPAETSASYIQLDGRACLVAIVRDISARNALEERLRFLSCHDALTALPDRLLLYDRLGQAIAQAGRSSKQLAVLFTDLDRFKTINDTLGHAAGDRVLKTVARRLNACVRETDTVARLSGDEFVILLTNLEDPSAADVVARTIQRALRRPFAINGTQRAISASIGISVFPEDGEDADSLLHSADVAMYRAKELGRDRVEFADGSSITGAAEGAGPLRAHMW